MGCRDYGLWVLTSLAQSNMIKVCRVMLLGLLISLLQISTPMPAIACLQGMSWGMDRSAVEQELGVALIGIGDSTTDNLYEARDLQLGDLQVERLRLRVADPQGLQRLAIELEPDAMTEVLAGLRHRFGPPVSTVVDEDGRELQQQWVWHTGEDLITAMRRENSLFLLDYKPTRIDPNLL